jgi:hypothetical protein
MLKIEEVNDFDRFVALRDEWNLVLGRSGDNNVFLTWEGFLLGGVHFGKERELTVLLAQDGENIVAAAPLMRSNYNLFGFKLKKMELLGAETYRLPQLYPNGTQKRMHELFLNYLYDLDWDFLEFRDIPKYVSRQPVCVVFSTRGFCRMNECLAPATIFPRRVGG